MAPNRLRLLAIALFAVLCVCLAMTWWVFENQNLLNLNDQSSAVNARPSGSPPPFLDLIEVATFFPEAVFLTPPAGEIARVTRIIDGDTIDVEINGRTYRVRYIGMDTPERGEVCFAEATTANTLLVSNQEVTLVKDVNETDRYDRLVRYVFVDDLFVDAALVAQGYARAYPYPPDTTYADYFDSLEAQARAAGLGCHPTGIFADRSDYLAPTVSPTAIIPSLGVALTPPLPAADMTTPATPHQFVCDCSKKCAAMSSCEEAYFQLQQCGCGIRDGDGDGVPCENICGGK